MYKQTPMNVYQQSSADMLPNHTGALANTFSLSVAKQPPVIVHVSLIVVPVKCLTCWLFGWAWHFMLMKSYYTVYSLRYTKSLSDWTWSGCRSWITLLVAFSVCTAALRSCSSRRLNPRGDNTICDKPSAHRLRRVIFWSRTTVAGVATPEEIRTNTGPYAK